MIFNPTLRSRLPLVATIVAICVIIDQVTKALAQAYLPQKTIHLLGDLVRLRPSENVGAFLSLGAGLPPQLRFWIFTVAGAVMLVIVTLYALTASELDKDMVIAIAFVLGGGLGNLIDRAFRQGRVIDFLNFGIGNVRTGILNVADIAITFGALYVIGAGLLENYRDST
jgi:signal peptidase II